MNNKPVNDQAILNNLYRLFGEKVFKEMQNRDESIPAEEFFNNLMADSLEFCVRISDSINRIEKASKPADVVPAQPKVEVKPEPVVAVAPPQPPQPQGKKCPRCNALCDDDSIFCASCGFKWPMVQPEPVAVPKPVVQPEPVAKPQPVNPPMPVPSADEMKPLFCGNCGTKLDGDSLFCINCGQKL